MKIESLKLINFRNYDQVELNFKDMVNVFYGKNGQGKTNLLEGIFYAAFAMSHKSNKEDELTAFNKENEGMAVFAEYESATGRHNLKIKRYPNGNFTKKEIFRDGKKITAKEHYGSLNAVMFSPEDLQIVKGSPSLRRRFIDMEISQTENLYYEKLLQYNRILRQRNKLLKQIREKKAEINSLDIWDEQISELNAFLISRRIINLHKIQAISREIFTAFSEGEEELTLKYESKDIEGKSIYSDEEDIAVWKAYFKENFAKNRFNDIFRGSTGIGAHRDDLLTFINGRDARAFGSQGQQRCVALALKLSQIEYVRQEAGEYPVLLLDDVMSELDVFRRKQLVGFISGKVQTFITVNDKELIPFFSANRYFSIEKGKVKDQD